MNFVAKNNDARTDLWAEAHGGWRGSLLLRLCAVAYLFAALFHFGVKLLAPWAVGPEHLPMLAALVAWDVVLFTMAGAFIMTGVNPVFSRMGIVVGAYTGIQAVLLLLSITTNVGLPIPPGILTLGRTLLLITFALVERPLLGSKTTTVLVLVPLLQFVRVLLRGLEILPPLERPWEGMLTATFMILTAAAIFAVASSLRYHEDRWAAENQPRRNAEFADFNNPSKVG
jgi:hypothetical protein